MQFKDIYGQEQLKQKLIQTADSGRISHAQLFLGPEGSGALPLAIAYAQYINCLKPIESDSCGVCASCVKFSKLIHPDLHFTFPTIAAEKKKLSNDFIQEWREAFVANPYLSELQWLLKLDDEGKKQGNITAEECRDIIRKLGLKSYEAKYKTVVIWLPEYLRLEGNIILKLLEEPPPQTLILLVAQDADKVIATILSRTQIVRIHKLSDEAVASALVADYQVPQAEAQTIARVSEGNLSMALTLIEAGRSDYHQLFALWMRACYSNNIAEMNTCIDKITGTGREFIKSFIGYTLHMLRSVFLYHYADDRLIKLSEEEKQFMVKFAFTMNADNLPAIIKALNETTFHIERNADLKITFLNLSLYIGGRLHKQKVQAG
jgi:DNA polymerase-3 subunit delta'